MSTQSQIDKLEVKLEGAKQELANEQKMSRASGECFPIVLNKLTREVAETEMKLNQLKRNLNNKEKDTCDSFFLFMNFFLFMFVFAAGFGSGLIWSYFN